MAGKRFLFPMMFTVAALGCGMAAEDGPTPPGDRELASQEGQRECTGCVDDAGRCVLFADAQACGTGGVACTVCSDGQTCSPEFTCEEPEPLDAELPANAYYTLVVVDGALSPTNLGGTAWDDNLPDPYLELHSLGGDYRFRTEHKDETLYPEWETPVVRKMLRERCANVIAAGFEVEVWDYDTSHSVWTNYEDGNDPFGACGFQLTTDEILSGEPVTISCPRDESIGRAGYSFRVRVEIEEDPPYSPCGLE